MREARASIWLAGIMTLLLIGVQIGVSQNQPAAQSDSAAVTGAGCVEKGVEAGCLVLKDKESGTSYSLSFSGQKPAIGSGIRFSGEKRDVSTCMQGQAVKVTSWSAVKMDCGQRRR
jgi:hypothetical protein